MKGREVKRIVIILVVALLGYIFIFGRYGLIKVITLKTKIINTERKIKISTGIREGLVADSIAIKSDTVRIKQLIRSFGMTRDGKPCTLNIR